MEGKINGNNALEARKIIAFETLSLSALKLTIASYKSWFT